MKPFVLDEIPLAIDPVQILQQFRIPREGERARMIRDMTAEACALARPKTLYTTCLIEGREQTRLVIGGRDFTSRVLAVNLVHTHRVFPFVSTCGVELEEWSRQFESGLPKFCAEHIKGAALAAALAAFLQDLEVRLKPGKVSMMNPGSLEDWPISEQRPLFDLMGDPASIGVELTERFLMKPAMSASGLWFASEEAYENCMLCPMADCPLRRAPYDSGLYERRYLTHTE